MNKMDALRKFVRDNYKLLNEKTQFDRIRYKDIKKDYFGRVLKHQFGNPNDKEICEVFTEALIKNEKILDKQTLQQEIERTPFLKINNRNADNYTAIIDSVSGEFALKDEVDGLRGIQKIEKQLAWLKKERSKEIEDLISQKEEAYRRLPSILDDHKFEEPEHIIQPTRRTDWWEDLNLRENPFPGPLDGFYMIDKSLYQSIIIETRPILWALEKLESPMPDIFHRGFLLAGEFGTGKTTFYDFIASHLIIKLIEPIRIALTENISEAHYVQKFENEICIAISNLCKQHHLTGTDRIMDFGEAKTRMKDLQKHVRGFLIFIDDLHKHTNLDLVFSFLSHLQIIKNNFSRDGIMVVFIVAGFPAWRRKIKQDSALSGFFDAADELTLPEVTPEIAAQAIKKRLQAFSVNPNKELEVKEEFLQSIFKKVSKERGIANIGFRPYIQEAVQRFQQKQFDILSVDITVLEPEVSQEIRATLEENDEFAKSINKLIFGGGIKKRKVRERALRILGEIYLGRGVTEDEEFFKTNVYYFQKLSEVGLIQKFRRERDDKNILVWNISPLLSELNDTIISKFHMSIEDYLVPVYLPITPRAMQKRSRIQSFERDLKKWGRALEPSYITNIQKALTGYSEHIFQFTKSQHRKSLSLDTLPTINIVKEPVWLMMKSIIQYESPQLLNICGENNIQGWGLRHRSLQCSEHFILLLHDIESTSPSVSDHTRLISFADEAFVELWNEFNESMKIYRRSHVRCYMLPKGFLKNIYAEYATLLYPSDKHTEYFQSLDRFLEQIEQIIRKYLHVSSTLIFGPLNRRITYYPDDINKYINRNLPSQSISYESYNEFEHLNRGQYRLLFQDSNKSSPFYRYIIRPIMLKWDNQDISSFFKIFGDVNIITSHNKTISAEDTKRDTQTFFRLTCRLIADMCLRLKELLMITNTTQVTDDATYIMFGYQYVEHEKLERFIKGIEIKPPEAIYKHEISEGLKSNVINDILNNSDNTFGCIELDMLEIEGIRIKFNREFCKSVPLIAYYLATGKIDGKPLYGASVWFQEI